MILVSSSEEAPSSSGHILPGACCESGLECIELEYQLQTPKRLNRTRIS